MAFARTTSIVSQGQGHATAFAQLTADELGLALEDVVIRAGDTSQAWGMGTWGSRGAVIGAGSIMHQRSLWYTVLVLVVCHLVAARGLWKRWSPVMPAPMLGAGYAVVLTLALVLAPDEGKAFIYFQF